MDNLTLINFNEENFIRVFVDIYFDHQARAKDIWKKGEREHDTGHRDKQA